MFEYKYLVLDMGDAESRKSGEDILNQLGKEKWEVVNFANSDTSTCIEVMLKRAI